MDLRLRHTTLACACVLTFSAGATAQTLTAADVQAAITAGHAKKFDHLISDCVATASFSDNLAAGMAGGIQPTGSFDVIVSGNAGRIAFLAADAKRLYKPFSALDIPDTLLTPALFVFADPHKPNSSAKVINVPSPVERIVLKSKRNADAVVQPETFETEPVEWSNLMGGTVTGTRALATFSLDAIREMPAGDVDVVLITVAGERRCKIGAKDRAKLFPGKSTDR
jgi:hypothetical protein